MKQFLAFCLVVYFLAEVSAKPSPQSMDQATDLIERLKQKFQDAMAKAQEAASGAVETVRNAMQNGLGQFAQQTAQSRLDPDEHSTQSGTTDMNQNTAAV